MKTTAYLYLLIGVLYSSLFISCDSSHFLKEEPYRRQVQTQFEKRKELAQGRALELFSVFDHRDLTTEETEALQFLYAYMPLSDMADYDGDFYLRQVQSALNTRTYFDWGKKIPDEIFRHFVLVHRVNNEDLDESRQVFFDELKDRVKGMSMEDAVLEVNHWCHEKVTYRATDGRTMSPLALVNTSWGRCGEESVFTVGALRAIGIPARQCYTPRWAHTDSNHAWVEAWVDGKWRYLGACEPEAELDAAWFSAPVKRAMMVHTRVFGLYNGPEQKNQETELYSVINVLSTYTDTREVKVRVVDYHTQEPIENASVNFEVYNYAEYFPIGTATTDKDGRASLITNEYGQLMIWANSGDKYDYVRSKFSEEDEIEMRLSVEKPIVMEEGYTIRVPYEHKVKELSKMKIAKNAMRLADEDSIRNAYMSTFINEINAKNFAKENNIDIQRTWDILYKSQGNWQEIRSFIKKEKNNPFVFDFLESLLEKDLRDTPESYLSDHISDKVNDKYTSDIYVKYVLSPRIGLELIRPWRSFFKNNLDKEFMAYAQEKPSTVVSYVIDNIKILSDENPFNCPLSPQGVYELKLADKNSRDIFFVALCRSMDIPARIEPATSRPQYYEDNKWVDVLFNNVETELPKGEIKLTASIDNIVKPLYSTHYTIAKLENGKFTTLKYRGDNALKTLPASIAVDAGYYRVLLGSRTNDASVTVLAKYITVEEGGIEKVEIKLPEVYGAIQVLGSMDPNSLITMADHTQKSLKELMNEQGVILCFADPGTEPTKHILQDLPAVQNELEEWEGGILFVVPDDKVSKAFDASAFRGLPKQSEWIMDTDRKILNEIVQTLQLDFANNFPLTVYINANGSILFSAEGYQIGIGGTVLRTIYKDKATIVSR